MNRSNVLTQHIPTVRVQARVRPHMDTMPIISAESMHETMPIRTTWSETATECYIILAATFPSIECMDYGN